MKKVISVVLALVMMLTVSCVAFAADSADSTETSFGAYKHVFIIGVDGSGASWGQYDTPNFDRIFGNGAVQYNAHTELVSVSAQNWGSILTGVDYLSHGFTNAIVERFERSSKSLNHSIFYYARQAMPDAQLVSFNHWDAINVGIIENDLGVEKINYEDDALVVDAIQNYYAEGNTPTLMFVQLDSVDAAGHSYGSWSDEYEAAVKNADVNLGKIYDSIDAAGLLEDSLFILVADHGERSTTGHGFCTREESSATVAVAGKTVNSTVLPTYTKNRDVSAIVLYALGIEEPSTMSSIVPEGLFNLEGDAERITKVANYSRSLAIHKAYDEFFTPFNKLVSSFVNYLKETFSGC